MSRRKKPEFMGNPRDPWIIVNKEGLPEKKDNKIRMYLNRRRCDDYINSRGWLYKNDYTPVRLSELHIAHILIT